MLNIVKLSNQSKSAGCKLIPDNIYIAPWPSIEGLVGYI